MKRCCERCGAALIKPATRIELTHHSDRGIERDVRVLCLDCAAAVVSYLQRRPEVLDPRLEIIHPIKAKLGARIQ